MSPVARHDRSNVRGVRVAVTGAGGQLGRYLRTVLEDRGAQVIGLGHRHGAGIDLVADLIDGPSVQRALAIAEPELVIHAAAYTDVDGCELNPSLAEAVNVVGSAHVAEAARAVGAHLVAISTDFVFAGNNGAPYAESADANPISAYGRSKLAGEAAVLSVNPDFAIVRTAWLYGGSGKHFPRSVLTILRDRGAMAVVTDERGSPTFAGDLAEAVLDLASAGPGGIFHLVNQGTASRFEFAQAIAQIAGLNVDQVSATTSAEFLAHYPLPARRPTDSSLANTRAAAMGIILRPWRDALHGYIPDLAAEIGLSRDEMPAGKGVSQT
jgi:dTDP-4-dehydrorhamnose reductase